MTEESLPPDECYRQMGFAPFTGGPHVAASDWRRVQDSNRLSDMRQRYLWLRDCAGQPLVDLGFIIGWVPPQRLALGELEKLLAALDEGLAAGCQTVSEWQSFKKRR